MEAEQNGKNMEPAEPRTNWGAAQNPGQRKQKIKSAKFSRNI